MSRGRTTTEITLLVTCVGRRVELLQAFRAAAGRLGLALRLVGLDTSRTAPALSCVDVPVIVPRADDPAYMPTVLDVIRQHDARALLPTTDTDLLAISEQRDAIDALGCTPLIAAPDVIRTCRDKTLTYAHLKRHGIDTPLTWTPEELPATDGLTFPLFIKPRSGSASQWVHKVRDARELEYYLANVPEPIVQEFVEGVEHTLDVYVGLAGTPQCVVPRARWQVRTGEVSKGVVVKDADIMAAGRALAASLGPTVRGLLTLQCMVTAERRIRFIEINPRFGGGAPLGIAAGADYPGWLLQELCGQMPKIEFDGFQHGLCMLRYDWSVFVPLAADCTPALNPPLFPFPPFGGEVTK